MVSEFEAAFAFRSGRWSQLRGCSNECLMSNSSRRSGAMLAVTGEIWTKTITGRTIRLFSTVDAFSRRIRSQMGCVSG